MIFRILSSGTATATATADIILGMDIFEDMYYPGVFDNYSLTDNWISRVYGKRRTATKEISSFKRHTGYHWSWHSLGQRQAELLNDEIQKGRKKIEVWLGDQHQIDE